MEPAESGHRLRLLFSRNYSRQLLYAKLYIQQGHTLQEMMSELQRIKALETLKYLPMKDMIPSQRDELRLFQQKPEKFVRYARKESRKSVSEDSC